MSCLRTRKRLLGTATETDDLEMKRCQQAAYLAAQEWFNGSGASVVVILLLWFLLSSRSAKCSVEYEAGSRLQSLFVPDSCGFVHLWIQCTRNASPLWCAACIERSFDARLSGDQGTMALFRVACETMVSFHDLLYSPVAWVKDHGAATPASQREWLCHESIFQAAFIMC